MTKTDLKELLKDNSDKIAYEIRASDLVDIKEFANLSLQIDKKTLDYYYEIDADELLNSEMPIEKYENLKNQGWCLINDKLQLILKN